MPRQIVVPGVPSCSMPPLVLRGHLPTHKMTINLAQVSPPRRLMRRRRRKPCFSVIGCEETGGIAKMIMDRAYQTRFGRRESSD